MPYDIPCTVKPEVVYHIQNLASAYSIETSTSATVTYLSQLTDVAARSNRSFKDLLIDELAKIEESLGGDAPTAEPSTELEPMSHHDEALPSLPLTANGSQVGTLNDTHPPVGAAKQTPQIPINLLSPPEVHWLCMVIVEHIVKSSDVVFPPNSQYRLKPFSGRVPHPPFETDYDTWRSSVESCLTDPSFTETQNC